MAINRAAIVQQLQWQLQQQFGQTTDVHLLQLPITSNDKPQLVIEALEETKVKDSQPKQLRQLKLAINCHIKPSDELLMLQNFDSIASGIDTVLTSQSQHNLWQQAEIENTKFDFTKEQMAQMTIKLALIYQQITADDCPDLTINQVYLSTYGGPHELVTALPDDQ